MLRAGRRRCHELWIASNAGTDERIAEIVAIAAQERVTPREVERAWLDERLPPGHQGVAALASLYPYAADTGLDVLASSGAPLLALDQLEDPRNVGALLRTAEATGVSLVVLPSDRSAAITPAVVNASAGATEHMLIARTTNLARWLAEASDAGYWSVGLAIDPRSQPLFGTDLPRPTVLVVGSEGNGLRRLVAERCDVLVELPMDGRIESLNAAVAGSIALYELHRRARADSAHD